MNHTQILTDVSILSPKCVVSREIITLFGEDYFKFYDYEDTSKLAMHMHFESHLLGQCKFSENRKGKNYLGQ